MSESPVQVLHVDRGPAVGSQTATILGREDGQFVFESAHSAAEALDRIGECLPDCVVSTYDLPDENGIELLRTVRDRWPELPFVLFPDGGSETLASEAISAGVTNYVETSSEPQRYETLRAAIERAVRSERSGTQTSRQENLMRLTEISGDTGGWELDLETKQLYTTVGTRRIAGLSRDDELSLDAAIDLYHPEDREEVEAALDRAERTGERIQTTWRIQPAGGDTRILDVTIIPVSSDGEVRTLRGTVHDVTDRYERKRQLEQTTSVMSEMEELADVGAWEYDPRADEVYTTAGTNRIYGLDAGTSLTLEEAFECYHPDDRGRLRDRFEACLETEGRFEMDVRVVTADDEQKWVAVQGAYVEVNGTGGVARGCVQDITERHEREAELSRQWEFIQQTLDTLDDLFYVLDADGTIRRWNDQVIEVTGYDPAELDGTPATEFFRGAEQQKIADEIEPTTQTDETTVEAALLTKDGEEIPYEWSSAFLTDADGEITGLVGIGRDITERKRREQRFRALVEESNDVIAVVDAEGRFRYQSPSVARVLGYDPAETIGDPVWEYIHPDDLEHVQRTFWEYIDTGETTETIEFRARHADGSWQWMEARGNNQLDNPTVQGVVVNTREITARKEREQYLTILDRVLRHNLRNDINVIRSRAETICAEASGTAADDAAEILRVSDQLLEMAEKERTIAKLLRTEPVREELNLRELLDTVASTARTDHPEATITVECPDATTLQATVEFERVIRELATNAVVHNESASPRVELGVTRTDGATRIEVADTGPRIPEMERNILTDETESTPLYHGTGIGLWLVKLITSRAGGTVVVEENSPTGNVVGIEFPER